MRSVRIFEICIFAFLFISCSSQKKIDQDNHTVEYDKDSLKVIVNNRTPSVPEDSIRVEFFEEAKIESNPGNDDDSYLLIPVYPAVTDSEMYFMDQNVINLNRFGKDYQFKDKLLRQGKGPGEIEFMINSVASNNDTLYVFGGFHLKYYTLDGEFIKQVLIQDLFSKYGEIKRFSRINDERFIISFNMWDKDEKGNTKYVEKLMLLDRNFSEICQLKKHTYFKVEDAYENSLNNNYLRYEYALNDSLIFVTEKCTDKYLIEVYDHNGKKKYSFKKTFRSIPYTKYENTAINSKIDERVMIVGEDMQKIKVSFGRKYKNVIRFIYCDKYGRLWVEVPTEDRSYNPYRTFDIFKDGIYLNTFRTKQFKPYYDVEFPIDSGTKLLEFYEDQIFYGEVLDPFFKIYSYKRSGL